MVKLYLTQINNGIIYMIALQQNIIFFKKERRSIYHYIINLEHELYPTNANNYNARPSLIKEIQTRRIVNLKNLHACVHVND